MYDNLQNSSIPSIFIFTVPSLCFAPVYQLLCDSLDLVLESYLRFDS